MFMGIGILALDILVIYTIGYAQYNHVDLLPLNIFTLLKMRQSQTVFQG